MTKQDLVDGFKKLGIEPTDTVFVTSSLSRFGNVEGGAETVIDALRDCCSGIIMPSFNFSIFKSDMINLDLDTTPSEMGIISETFRKNGVNRTSNLFHPLCYENVPLDLCDTYDTWGEESAYAYMANNGVKMLMLGTDFYSCPIFHYCEQRNNVPYREPIEYAGFVDGKPTRCRRLRRKHGDSDNNKVYNEFCKLLETKIGTAYCRSFLISDMVDFLDVRLQQDPEYLLLRDDTLSTMPTMVTFDMMEGIQELFKYDRQLTGEGFNDALDYLSQFVPLRIHNWVGGDKCWTWTIPEGGLRLGEYIVKGFGNETIILPIHLDHSGMANDNLSGVAVAMKLIDMLQRTPDLKYSYKFLFVPETIGTIAYLSMFGYRYKYGIVIDSVGTTGDIVVTQSKMLSKLNMYIENKTNTFLSDEHLNTGNDERVLESVGIPSIQVSRSPFKEYHTKDDTPDIIDEPKLYGALFITYDIIKRMERDFRPCPTYTGVPCLSAYDLWQPDINLEKIYHMLTYRLYISEIAGTTGLPFDFIYDFVMKMREKGLC